MVFKKKGHETVFGYLQVTFIYPNIDFIRNSSLIY